MWNKDKISSKFKKYFLDRHFRVVVFAHASGLQSALSANRLERSTAYYV